MDQRAFGEVTAFSRCGSVPHRYWLAFFMLPAFWARTSRRLEEYFWIRGGHVKPDSRFRPFHPGNIYRKS